MQQPIGNQQPFNSELTICMLDSGKQGRHHRALLYMLLLPVVVAKLAACACSAACSTAGLCARAWLGIARGQAHPECCSTVAWTEVPCIILPATCLPHLQGLWISVNNSTSPPSLSSKLGVSYVRSSLLITYVSGRVCAPASAAAAVC